MELQQALQIIDDLTPYYRRRMESLPIQQRRVVCALGRNGTSPINSTLIARESRMEPRAAATALSRLKQKGIVSHVNRRWALTDPWLGAWYRLRNGDMTRIPTETPPIKPCLHDALLMATGERIRPV